MENFKMLQANQYFMGLMGIYPEDLTESTTQFFRLIPNYYIICVTILNIICCGAFIYLNPTDFVAALEAIMVILAVIQGLCMYLTIGTNWTKVKALHLELQTIVDNSTFPRFFLHIRLC